MNISTHNVFEENNNIKDYDNYENIRSAGTCRFLVGGGYGNGDKILVRRNESSNVDSKITVMVEMRVKCVANAILTLNVSNIVQNDIKGWLVGWLIG